LPLLRHCFHIPTIGFLLLRLQKVEASTLAGGTDGLQGKIKYAYEITKLNWVKQSKDKWQNFGIPNKQ
jgi:hypothetical protein